MSSCLLYHQSVLSGEVVSFLNAKEGGVFLDLTLGGGGHSQLILDSNIRNRVFGIDCDYEAIEYARKKLSKYGSRFLSFHSRFSQVDFVFREMSESISGIIMDLGVSSHQIDELERGFSFQFDCCLDMRMDRSGDYSAVQVLNEKSEDELASIFYLYGEEKMSRKIAKNIVRFRERKDLTRSKELSEIVRKSIGVHNFKLKKSLARIFQAIRIEVNQELEELKMGLAKAYDLLAPKGRLVVISFHSLEDRIVKNFFAEKCKTCVCPDKVPVCICEKKKEGILLNKKVVMASPEELSSNNRASSAKLRAIEKI